jgi:uncharacterized membrane protein YdfJ with MMPL/SSD domain
VVDGAEQVVGRREEVGVEDGDELAGGADRTRAVTTMMVTAGRTVLFSAFTVA